MNELTKFIAGWPGAVVEAILILLTLLGSGPLSEITGGPLAVFLAAVTATCIFIVCSIAREGAQAYQQYYNKGDHDELSK